LNTNDFISRIEGYYGAKYSAGQLPYVKTYLARKSDNELDYIFAETLKVFSSQFGRCPDISVFDKANADIKNRIEQNKPEREIKGVELPQDFIDMMERHRQRLAMQEPGYQNEPE